MRVLMVFHNLTWPAQSGVTKRNFHLLEEVARRHDTTVISLGSREDEERIRGRMGGACRKVTFVDVRRPRWLSLLKRLELELRRRSVLQLAVTPRLQRELDEAAGAGPFDVVFISAPLVAWYRFPPGVPRIQDTHNVEYDMCHRFYQQATNPLSRAYFLDQYRLMRRDELAACRAGDALLTTSERDRDVFRRDLPDQDIHVIPNGVDLEHFAPAPGEPEAETIVFTGLMNYPPNDQGIAWFLDRVFPLVQREVPGARLAVVGSGPSRALQRRATDRITVTGWVEDVRPYIARGQVYVVPLLVGGGTRLKALEAMAMRKPIVTTRVGCEGIDLHHEDSALFADEPEAFAAAVVRLFRDPGLRSRLAARAAATAAGKYGWGAIGERLDAVLRQVAARRRPSGEAPSGGR